MYWKKKADAVGPEYNFDMNKGTVHPNPIAVHCFYYIWTTSIWKKVNHEY